ncbi:MAG: BolA family transcriptional regulator [Rhodospirillaceae bacterium]|jgi:BolA family transcriptional regulator, general stress-responsive regulator|nr:BolA family transcriptional regulator [Rhodospirillaceae bacterium]MBT6136415.1 BolA family transcriptional regulator [Rhodospirillaceae bacterium]
MSVAETIKAKLTAELSPISLDVNDESAKHAGHVGARPEGETHFHVEIISQAFRGLSRVERQRLVYKVLSEELSGPVHALSIKATPPAE